MPRSSIVPELIFLKSTAELDTLNIFHYEVFCSLIIQAIKQSLDCNKWSVMIMVRQNWIITYKGVAAQPTTISLSHPSPLGCVTLKEFIFSFGFHLLDLQHLKASQVMLSNSDSLLYELNITSILRYTEEFSFTVCLPSQELHACIRADSLTRQSRWFVDGLLKEATQKPAEHYRIYKNRRRRISMLFFTYGIWFCLPCTCTVTRKHRVPDMFLLHRSCWGIWLPDMSQNMKLNSHISERLLYSDLCKSNMT